MLSFLFPRLYSITPLDIGMPHPQLLYIELILTVTNIATCILHILHYDKTHASNVKAGKMHFT